jgi:hypothetical protein
MNGDHSKAPARLPDWLLERLALDELPEERRREVMQRLSEEPGGMARLEALRRDDGEFLAAHAPAVIAAQIVERARRGAPRRERTRLWSVGAWTLAAASAMAIVLLAVPSARDAMIAPWESDTRVKGLEPVLLVFRQTPRGAEQLSDGSEVRAGDQLQLAYVAAGRRYGTILSIDGRGVVTQHYPEGRGNESADFTLPPKSREAGGPTALAHAYALDDAPDFERFFFVTSDTPFDLERLLVSARAFAADSRAARTGRLPVPRGMSQTTIMLRKEQP